MGNSLRLWDHHMTLLFKKLFWSPPHSKSILENLIHKYSLLLLWDSSHVIPFSFFFFCLWQRKECACCLGQSCALLHWVVLLLVPSLHGWSLLCIVCPKQNKNSKQHSMREFQVMQRKSDTGRRRIRERDQGSLFQDWSWGKQLSKEKQGGPIF